MNSVERGTSRLPVFISPRWINAPFQFAKRYVSGRGFDYFARQVFCSTGEERQVHVISEERDCHVVKKCSGTFTRISAEAAQRELDIGVILRQFSPSVGVAAKPPALLLGKFQIGNDGSREFLLRHEAADVPH